MQIRQLHHLNHRHLLTKRDGDCDGRGGYCEFDEGLVGKEGFEFRDKLVLGDFGGEVGKGVREGEGGGGVVFGDGGARGEEMVLEEDASQ